MGRRWTTQPLVSSFVVTATVLFGCATALDLWSTDSAWPQPMCAHEQHPEGVPDNEDLPENCWPRLSPPSYYSSLTINYEDVPRCFQVDSRCANYIPKNDEESMTVVIEVMKGCYKGRIYPAVNISWEMEKGHDRGLTGFQLRLQGPHDNNFCDRFFAKSNPRSVLYNPVEFRSEECFTKTSNLDKDASYLRFVKVTPLPVLRCEECILINSKSWPVPQSEHSKLVDYIALSDNFQPCQDGDINILTSGIQSLAATRPLSVLSVDDENSSLPGTSTDESTGTGHNDPTKTTQSTPFSTADTRSPNSSTTTILTSGPQTAGNTTVNFRENSTLDRASQTTRPEEPSKQTQLLPSENAATSLPTGRRKDVSLAESDRVYLIPVLVVLIVFFVMSSGCVLYHCYVRQVVKERKCRPPPKQDLPKLPQLVATTDDCDVLSDTSNVTARTLIPPTNSPKPDLSPRSSTASDSQEALVAVQCNSDRQETALAAQSSLPPPYVEEHSPAAVSRSAYISYARDNGDHAEKVVGLAAWLRDQGISAVCDLYFDAEVSRNPPAFIESQMHNADYIIVICSSAYLHCWEMSNNSQRKDSNPQGDGAVFQLGSKLDLTLYEIFLLRNMLFQTSTKRQIIPVHLVKKKLASNVRMSYPDIEQELVPVPLQGFRLYKLGSMDVDHILDQRDLLYRLHGQPLYTPVPPGNFRS